MAQNGSEWLRMLRMAQNGSETGYSKGQKNHLWWKPLVCIQLAMVLTVVLLMASPFARDHPKLMSPRWITRFKSSILLVSYVLLHGSTPLVSITDQTCYILGRSKSQPRLVLFILGMRGVPPGLTECLLLLNVLPCSRARHE